MVRRVKPWQWIFILLVGIGIIATIKISRSGIDKIKGHEALKLKPYKDVGGKWSIGFGHLIKKTETYLLNPNGITKNIAEKLLRQDLNTAEKAVNELVTVSLTSNQYDSLISFVYNVGVYAFSDSTLLKKLNEKNYENAANEFKRWKYAGGKISQGLINRRQREESLFRSA